MKKNDTDKALRESEARLKIVLEGINEAFYALDSQWHFVFASRSALSLWDKPASEVIGRPFLETFPIAEGSEAYEAHRRVMSSRIAERFETISPVIGRWIDVNISPTEEGGLSVCFRDIGDRKRTEQALQKSEEKYRTLFDTMDEGLAIIELERDAGGALRDMVYKQANPAFQKHTGLDDPVGRRVSELMPNLERSIIEMIERAADTGKPERAETYKHDLDRWFDVVYTRIGGPGSSQVAALFKDVTERKQREQQQEYLLRLNDTLGPLGDPLAIQRAAMQLLGETLRVDRVIYSEVEDDETTHVIADNYVSEGVSKITGRIPSNDLKGSVGRSTGGKAFAVADMTMDERISDAARTTFLDPSIRSMIGVPLVKNDRWVAYLSIHNRTVRQWSKQELAMVEETAERTWAALEKTKAEEALRRSEKRLQSIANLVPDLLWDSEADGSTNWYNHRWLEYTGQSLEEAIGWGWVDTIHPNDREASARRYAEAVKAGKPFQQEHRIRRHDGEYRWFVINASPIKNKNGEVIKMYGAATDIHDRKRAEETLRESELQYRVRLENEVKDRTAELHQNRALLQATLDSNAEMIQVFKAVRDDKGKIIDFVWILNNATSEQIYGDVIGKSLLQKNPGVVEIGIFDHFIEVTETGIPQQYEKHYVYEQFDGWFYQSVVKLNDGVATNTVNITERKRAELQLKESKDSLQTIFDTTLVGMSVFAPVRNEDGRIIDFRIVTVNKKIERSSGRTDMVGKLYAELFPGIKKMGLFDLMVKTIETGEPGSMEYHYTFEGIDRWYSTMFIKGDDTLVSTNIDITERIRAEEGLRKLEADQQRQIFEVSLATLEEERQRISESLHNGIGQILYGIKINLTGFKYGITKNEFDEIKAYTSKLLTGAIIETRRISHELMPATLQQFGLKSAIGDICTQLSNGTNYQCQVSGLHQGLEKYMELAIYRTAQELMTNVAKHAKATQCNVLIQVGKDQIHINVIDNGQGMPTDQKRKPGIGLASIRSKIKLLNGDLRIRSQPGQGTTIEVIIPQPNR